MPKHKKAAEPAKTNGLDNSPQKTEEPEEDNSSKNKERKHDDGAADLEKVTDFVEEKEISAQDIQQVKLSKDVVSGSGASPEAVGDTRPFFDDVDLGPELESEPQYLVRSQDCSPSIPRRRRSRTSASNSRKRKRSKEARLESYREEELNLAREHLQLHREYMKQEEENRKQSLEFDKNMMEMAAQLLQAVQTLTARALSVPAPHTVYQAMSQPLTQYMPQPLTQSMPQPLTHSMPQPLSQSMPQPLTHSMPQPLSQSMPQPLTQYMPQPRAQTDETYCVREQKVHNVDDGDL